MSLQLLINIAVRVVNNKVRIALLKYQQWIQSTREGDIITHAAGCTTLWPLLTSFGTLGLFLSQNQILTNVLLLSSANHPPPFWLNAVPKLFKLGVCVGQPSLQSFRIVGPVKSCWTYCLQSKRVISRCIRTVVYIYFRPEQSKK